MGYFIPYSVNSGKYNMDFDEKMLDFVIEHNIPVLRLYGWNPPCVSLGRNQNDDMLNLEYCRTNNIDVVRRLTGGRGLLHDNELTYSFVVSQHALNNGESVISSYKEISSALAMGFREYGIDLEFPANKKAVTKFDYCMSVSTGADLSFDGKKLIGSAQFRKNGCILQHGSVLIDYDASKIEAIFKEKPQEDKITTLNKIKTGFTIDSLCNSIKTGFEEYFGFSFESKERI